MDMSYQSTFVQMFAVSWLVENFSTWHFTTLCGIFVECTMNVCPVNKSRWETLKLVLWCYRMVSVSMSLYILRCFKSRWHTNKTNKRKTFNANSISLLWGFGLSNVSGAGWNTMTRAWRWNTARAFLSRQVFFKFQTSTSYLREGGAAVKTPRGLPPGCLNTFEGSSTDSFLVP